MDLKEKKLEELKKFAKKNKLVGYSKLNKSDLIKFIKKYIKSTKNKKNTKVLSKKNTKVLSKKMVGGYILPPYSINPDVYIPLRPNSEDILPDNTFTIYTTGIKYAYLRYIWSFILAPRLNSIIPENRLIRIIHSELFGSENADNLRNHSNLETYLNNMDRHVFGNHLHSTELTKHTLDFNIIESLGIKNHLIIDFAHLFKYSIDNSDLVYDRLAANEEDITSIFKRNQNTFFTLPITKQNKIRKSIAESQITDCRKNGVQKICDKIREHKISICEKIASGGHNEAADCILQTQDYYNLNVITFGFVGHTECNYTILNYNIFNYQRNRIITYIYNLVENNKVFETNYPGDIFKNNREIIRDYYNQNILSLDEQNSTIRILEYIRNINILNRPDIDVLKTNYNRLYNIHHNINNNR